MKADSFSVFFACAFVGFMRLLLEWGLGGTYLLFPASDLAMSFAYYWLEAHLLILALGTALGLGRRGVLPAALAGTALDLLPPLIDHFVTGGPVSYGYFTDFPGAFHASLYGPESGVTLGEAAAWWSLVAAAAGYAAFRTRSAGRAAAAAGLTYAAAVVLLAVIPSGAAAAREALAWPAVHQRTLYILCLVFAVVATYGALAPALAAGLARRLPHALPFTAFTLVGAAFAGAVTPAAWVAAGALLLAFTAALAQNDLYDAAEDGLQGRRPYAGEDDVRFLTITAGLVIVSLAAAGSMTSVPLLVVLVLAILYSFPFYRGKQYFPSNLKMEGMWGLSSFTLGVTAALEQTAFGAPRWWPGPAPAPAVPGALRAFDDVTLAAMALVLGGYSLVAVLKDYKDREADGAAGVQTVYTLAARRGRPLDRVHAAVVASAAAALAAAPILLAVAGRFSWAAAAAGPVAAALLWVLMAGKPSPRAFTLTLFLLTGYFLFLAAALAA